MAYASSIEKRIKAIEGVVAATVTRYPDEVEQAFRIAVEYKQANYHRTWHLNHIPKTGGELHSECGSQPDPVTAGGGFWVHISIGKYFGNSYEKINLGGVWGYPCAHRIRGLVSVDHEVVRDLLLSRGWTLWGHDNDRYRNALLSHPSTPVESLTDQRRDHEHRELLKQLDLEQITRFIQLAHQEQFVRSLETL